MKQTRIIVVDDEPDARQRIVELVAQDPTLEVVCECRNGTDAIQAIQKHKPDLVLLDVNMPVMNGFEVVRRIGPHRMPFTIFVTAYDQFALKAFEVNAVDYLLKPYDDTRFHAAITKAKKLIAMNTNDKLTGRLMELVRGHLNEQNEFTEAFTIRDKGRDQLVHVDDVIFLRAEGNYLKLVLTERSVLYRMTMNAVETELDPSRFLRIHRSYLVNTRHIRNTRYSGNNEFIFSMANGERIISGRSYKEQIAKVLTGSEATN
ncbi:MAG: response regulator transcription factor [Flavobacteriales bacterium]|nr:response regulator transcription factor [Flavobacteriales bacterium]MBP6641750.1 response regulator transcription factor [Flavobacteriales bacterium]MBP7156661.1 response regulator transcription factor [Flavobacteriales bacterium]HQV76071.1 LytTR family DNA-binding domain-containing protein [Flavobacteriales bacterium]HQW41712.1 LytTR family DNA-binding domain-containing protein [Flavobacteriales bacterium]